MIGCLLDIYLSLIYLFDITFVCLGVCLSFEILLAEDNVLFCIDCSSRILVSYFSTLVFATFEEIQETSIV